MWWWWLPPQLRNHPAGAENYTTAATIPSSYGCPSVLDIRSLAGFRILLGLYLIYDVYSRLCLGAYDWAWYISSPEHLALVADTDTPHRAPLHQLWFYRGTLFHQQVLFGITTLLISGFALGILNAGGRIILYLFLTAQQCRHMTGTDGSDLYCRLMILWTIFLPVNEAWSMGECLWFQRFRKKTKVRNSTNTTVQGLACLGLTLQIAFMYWGTIFHRLELVKYEWTKCGWLPPRLDAVHYALSGSFSVRNHVLNRLIQRNPLLSRSMTAAATLAETILPIGCLAGGRYRHWYALGLVQLHLGLLVCMNLPHWQIVAVLAHVIFIPSHVWDYCCWPLSPTTARDEPNHKKTDGDVRMATNEDLAPAVAPHPRRLRPNFVSHGFQIFFFAYAVFNFLANRGILPKWDNGDIGEALRISQNWIMFGRVSQQARNVFVTGYTNNIMTKNNNNSSAAYSAHSIDILRYLSDGTMQPQVPDTRIIPIDMSDRYPSARYERALYTWAGKSPVVPMASMKQYCKTMCVLLNQNGELHLQRVELRVQSVTANPPGASARFDASSRRDTVAHADC